jgi:hypothetical protein
LTACIRAKNSYAREAKEATQASETLLHHFNMVADSMNLINHFARSYRPKGDDQIIIQLLGVRLFNGSASAVRDMLAGYYQNSVIQQRDLLEVLSLLDYFRTNPSMIVEWKTSNETERSKKFGAFQVRKAFDDRDAFTERKREAHYKLLCNLGAHSSVKRLLRVVDLLGHQLSDGGYSGEQVTDRKLSTAFRARVNLTKETNTSARTGGFLLCGLRS